MRKSPRIALSHGWFCRKTEYYGSLSGSSNSQDGSIKADEEGIQYYDNLDSSEGDRFDNMGESSLEEDSKRNGNDDNDEDDQNDDDDDDDGDSSKSATRTVVHHQSMGDDKSFAYPVPVTETPLELSQHTWSRFICFSTVRQHYILDGSSYDPDPGYTDHCLWINLHSPSGTWAGVLESNFTRAEDAMSLKGSRCEVVVSSEVVKRRSLNKLRELEYCDALKSVEVYEFYNVVWIEWQDGIAYRKGIGRVWKETWDGQDSEKVDVVLG